MIKNKKYFYFEIDRSGTKKASIEGFSNEGNNQYTRIHFKPSIDAFCDIHTENQKVSIKIDSMGVTPVFLNLSDKLLFLSSHTSLIPNNKKLCRKNIDILSEGGLLSSDETLWQGVIKCAPDFRYEIDFSLQEPQIQRVPVEKNEFVYPANPKAVVEALHSAVKKVVSNSDSGLFALSGGADSRLILSLLDEGDRKSLTFYTKANPNLSGNTDVDAVIAKKIAVKMGLNHQVVEKPQFYLAFLVPEFTTGSPISGLYGGEILGGAGSTELINGVNGSYSPQWIRKTINTSRSLIYGQKDYGWASPYTLTYFTDTPFLNGRVMDIIHAFNKDEVAGYRLYTKIWGMDEFLDLAQIPFSSPIAGRTPLLKKAGGVDPKVIPAIYQLETVNKNHLNLQLENFLPLNPHPQLYENLDFFVRQSFSHDPYLLL